VSAATTSAADDNRGQTTSHTVEPSWGIPHVSGTPIERLLAARPTRLTFEAVLALLAPDYAPLPSDGGPEARAYIVVRPPHFAP
jgi:hypothetical protein